MLLSKESTKTADIIFTAAASHHNEIILMSCAVFMPKFPKCSDYDRIEGFGFFLHFFFVWTTASSSDDPCVRFRLKRLTISYSQYMGENQKGHKWRLCIFTIEPKQNMNLLCPHFVSSIKCAFCSFGEEIWIRRERSSLKNAYTN